MTIECAAGLFEWSMQHQDGSNSNGGNVKELDPAKKEWCVWLIDGSTIVCVMAWQHSTSAAATSTAATVASVWYQPPYYMSSVLHGALKALKALHCILLPLFPDSLCGFALAVLECFNSLPIEAFEPKSYCC